jgi:pimeloyl-ACP methyl ester carboxylesterase
VPTLTTDRLEIAYADEGEGPPVLLLHGWPDSPRCWAGVAPALRAAGYRTVVPALRGTAPTRLRPGVPRTAPAVALAADAADLLDGLGLDRVHVVGHDWGARAAYGLAALWPQRVASLTALAVAWEPGPFRVPGWDQARRWWYQWLLCAPAGAAAVRADPVGFGRDQWATWSPPGWWDEAELAATAAAWRDPDWAEVTVHGYAVRWGAAAPDPAYAALQARYDAVASIGVPTLFVQGGADGCDPPATGDGAAAHFTGGYDRAVVPGAGHFVPREAPGTTVELVLGRLRATAGSPRTG